MTSPILPLFNERAWGIQVIGEINRLLETRHLAIRQAGGEYGTAADGKSTLFPDVILFGDAAERLILQGWELKTPETPIDDPVLLDNAQEKAIRMRVSSFLVWNGQTAVLYEIRGSNRQIVRQWTDPSIKTRAHLASARPSWKRMLASIVDGLNEYLSGRPIQAGTTSPGQLSGLVSGIVATQEGVFVDSLRETYRRRQKFRAELDSWWILVHREHGADETDSDAKFSAKAREALLHCALRILFVHYMKTFVAEAGRIDMVSEQGEFDALCAELSKTHDYAHLLRPQSGIPPLPDNIWTAFRELNGVLVSSRLASIGQEELHRTAQAIFQETWSKATGLFCTPRPLAELLVRLSIDDVEDAVILDPCCGTGTIPRAVMDFKRSVGLSEENATVSVWASDRFPAPLSFATLALSSGRNVNNVIHVFQQDALKLAKGQSAKFCDPATGETITERIPSFTHLLFNPPFIRFEDWGRNYDVGDSIVDEAVHLAKTRKADFLVPLILHLAEWMPPRGVMGVILPNSWLGTGWGRVFRQELMKLFHIRFIVGSGKGRWFQNADIVTNLVVLQRKAEEPESPTRFMTTRLPIEQWSSETIGRMVNEAVLADTVRTAEPCDIRMVSPEMLRDMESNGVTWTAGFVNLDWIDAISPHLVPAANLFEIARGERRGWDALFFPDASDIDPEYAAPVVLSSAHIEGLIARPDGTAFCCPDSMAELEQKNARKTLAWIRRFEQVRNGTGRPLPEVLRRPGMHWYEMSPHTKADIALSMNPGERLFFMRLKEPTFVNQRLIRLSAKADSIDIRLCHALLCSVTGCFFLEALGFGRGLGALDLNATKLQASLKMLDPGKIDARQKARIHRAFMPLLNRPVKPFLREIRSGDRIRFERAVLSAYSCEQWLDPIVEAATRLHEIRLSATDTCK